MIILGRSHFFAAAMIFGVVGSASAAPIAVNFEIEVQSRETHDDFAGFSRSNWVEDASYGGQTFELEFLFDTSDLVSNNSLAYLSTMTTLVAETLTPLTAEVSSFFTPYAFISLDSRYSFYEDAFPNSTSGGHTFSSGMAAYDTADEFDASRFSGSALQLSYSYDYITYDIQQFLDGHIIAGEEVVNGLSELAASNASFVFNQYAQTYIGGFSEFVSGTGYQTGLRYSGTGRVVSVGAPNVVSGPGSIWLLLVSLLLLRSVVRRRV